MTYQPSLRPSLVPHCGRLRASRLLIRIVLAVMVLTVGGAFVVPWTQNVRGAGKVIAYSPSARSTPIRAPIPGQIDRWLVTEGERVEKGQVLAELIDNDQNILDRLGRARDAVQSKGTALQSAIAIGEEQVASLVQARVAAVETATQKVAISAAKRDAIRQQVIAAQAKLKTAEINLSRQQQLNAQDLVSDRDLELAILAEQTARNELIAKRASLRGAQNEMKAATATLEERRTSKQASIEKAKAELQKLRGDLGETDAKVADAEVKLSRQQQMRIVAPRAGTILEIVAREGTDYLKAGDTLAVLIPDTEDRAVELWLSGNDAPLVREGSTVRLQFEGWPAVQFIGWPSVAAGTFGGVVAFVDRAASADGTFRVVVLPDENDQEWPESQYLRQGVRVKGWVLLNQVTVAYELWRQLNGFPPALTQEQGKKQEKK